MTDRLRQFRLRVRGALIQRGRAGFDREQIEEVADLYRSEAELWATAYDLDEDRLEEQVDDLLQEALEERDRR